MLHIRCKNNNVTKAFPEGCSLLDVYQEFADEIKLPYPVVSAKVNNASEGLKFRLYQNRDVEFLDAREGSGHRVYVRSLCFLLYKATQDVFPGSKLFIEHTISRGYYCNFKKKNNEGLTDGDIEQICERMKEIVNLDMPFRRTEATNEEAIRVFAERGFSDKVKLLETSGQIYSDYYMLGDTADYYYGPLVPSAGYLKVFGLEPYHDGMLLRVPDWNNPTVLAEKVDMPKTYEMFREKTKIPRGGETHSTGSYHWPVVIRKDHVLQATLHPTAGLWPASDVVLYRRLFRQSCGYAQIAQWRLRLRQHRDCGLCAAGGPPVETDERRACGGSGIQLHHWQARMERQKAEVGRRYGADYRRHSCVEPQIDTEYRRLTEVQDLHLSPYQHLA